MALCTPAAQLLQGVVTTRPGEKKFQVSFIVPYGGCSWITRVCGLPATLANVKSQFKSVIRDVVLEAPCDDTLIDRHQKQHANAWRLQVIIDRLTYDMFRNVCPSIGTDAPSSWVEDNAKTAFKFPISFSDMSDIPFYSQMMKRDEHLYNMLFTGFDKKYGRIQKSIEGYTGPQLFSATTDYKYSPRKFLTLTFTLANDLQITAENIAKIDEMMKFLNNYFMACVVDYDKVLRTLHETVDRSNNSYCYKTVLNDKFIQNQFQHLSMYTKSDLVDYIPSPLMFAYNEKIETIMASAMPYELISVTDTEKKTNKFSPPSRIIPAFVGKMPENPAMYQSTDCSDFEQLLANWNPVPYVSKPLPPHLIAAIAFDPNVYYKQRGLNRDLYM